MHMISPSSPELLIHARSGDDFFLFVWVAWPSHPDMGRSQLCNAQILVSGKRDARVKIFEMHGRRTVQPWTRCRACSVLPSVLSRAPASSATWVS